MNLQEIAKKETTTIVDVRESFETFFGKVDGAVPKPISTLCSLLSILCSLKCVTNRF